MSNRREIRLFRACLNSSAARGPLWISCEESITVVKLMGCPPSRQQQESLLRTRRGSQESRSQRRFILIPEPAASRITYALYKVASSDYKAVSSTQKLLSALHVYYQVASSAATAPRSRLAALHLHYKVASSDATPPQPASHTASVLGNGQLRQLPHSHNLLSPPQTTASHTTCVLPSGQFSGFPYHICITKLPVLRPQPREGVCLLC